jgi:cytochrome P450
MQSLGFILENIFLTVATNGVTNVPDYLLPKTFLRLKVSLNEFKMYMEEFVLNQMRASNKEGAKSQNKSLLEGMINANEAEKRNADNVIAKQYLSESELYGNLFVFNLAGFETTASTMTFALSFLAAHIHIQEWVTEEVDQHYTNSVDRDYGTIYPKLVRCLATVRKFPLQDPDQLRSVKCFSFSMSQSSLETCAS